MPQAAFIAGGVTLAFSRAPLPPARSRGYVQASVTSGGGERLARDWYARNEILEMTLRLTESEYSAVRTFFTDTVRGMALPFTYLDPMGVSTSVRFADPKLGEAQEVAYDSYRLPVRVRVV